MDQCVRVKFEGLEKLLVCIKPHRILSVIPAHLLSDEDEKILKKLAGKLSLTWDNKIGDDGFRTWARFESIANIEEWQNAIEEPGSLVLYFYPNNGKAYGQKLVEKKHPDVVSFVKKTVADYKSYVTEIGACITVLY
jgi:hypothetical protein